METKIYLIIIGGLVIWIASLLFRKYKEEKEIKQLEIEKLKLNIEYLKLDTKLKQIENVL